jgi:cytochrome P450
MRRVAGTGVSEGAGETEYAPPLVLSDDPQHRRVRSLVSKAFTPRSGKPTSPRTGCFGLRSPIAGRGRATI